jgi:hypothetical protein
MSTRDDRPGEPDPTRDPDAPHSAGHHHHDAAGEAEPHRHHREHSGGGEHLRPGHDRTEGEYEDKDVTPGEVEPEAVGTYVDRDVAPHEQERPPDEGEYTDRDEPGGRRHVEHEGSYTDVDPEGPHATGFTEERDDTHG